MMVSGTAVCTRASFDQIIPRFVPAVTLFADLFKKNWLEEFSNNLISLAASAASVSGILISAPPALVHWLRKVSNESLT